ncbi:MAG: hypothetical protein CSB47_07700 [Proteobacteria bacterium]|nr:MAG: hypothetical protein CSB47_07700 [Pseudomonadota bacterium]
MPRIPLKSNSPSQQTGATASKFLLTLVSIALLMLLVIWGVQKKYPGITAPFQKINPFGESKDEFAGFGVQVIATTNLAEAKRVMNKFASDGYPAFVVKNSQRGSPLYLVRLGPYSRSEAIAINDKIKRRYKKSVYVRDSFVVYREG